MRRAFVTLAAAVAFVAALPAVAGASPTVVMEIVADAAAQAFALRPSYDSGGQTPLNVYVGYTDANLSTPDPQADGQASWYNFGIAETAAFSPPEDCTPQKNLEVTRDGTVPDLQAWAEAYRQYLAEALEAGDQPVPPDVPSFRHACTERFPGFTQSRSPATHRCEDGVCSGIREHERDDFLTKPLCKDPAACAAWQPAASAAGPGAGSFVSESTAKPGADSAAVVTSLGDGTMLTIAASSLRSRTVLDGATLVAEASATLHDVCIGRSASGCALHIDEIRQVASVRVTPRAKAVRSQRTVYSGVRRAGTSQETDVVVVDGDTAGMHQYRCCYNETGSTNQLIVDPVTTTGGCTPVQGASSYAIADAGGLRIFGKGNSGGGITIGGACARARIDSVLVESSASDGGEPVPPVPPRTVVVAGPPVPPCPQCAAGPRVVVGPPRLVTRELVSSTRRPALAWRTAGIWGPSLGVLIVAAGLGWTFRRRPAMQPVLRGLDRFARQFIRG